MKFFEPIFALFGYFLSFFIEFFTTRIYKSKIIFNTCWEDVRCDTEALQVGGDDVVLIITSAGENAIVHALNGAKKVICIDRNPCQNALLELKIAAIKELDYESFWKMFGDGLLPNFTKEYYPRLRKYLTPAAAEFWDGHSHYFDGSWFRASFYFRGMSGALAWLIYVYLHAIPGLWKSVTELLQAKTVEEQHQIYFDKIEKVMWNPIVKKLLQSSATLSSIGVPVAQQDLLSHETNIGAFLKRSLEIVLTELPLRENYFWRVYMEGHYQRDSCPEYLIEENFNKLKDGLIDRVEFHTTTITDFLKEYPKKDISKYILLDHMDWMSSDKAFLSEEWQQIVDHSTPNAQYIWRSAAKKTEFVDDTTIVYNGKETRIGDIVEFDVELAEKLHEVDRVHTYTSFWMCRLKGDVNGE